MPRVRDRDRTHDEGRGSEQPELHVHIETLHFYL
jgi:hypothetical protein